MFKKPSSQRAVVVQIDQIPQPNTIDSMNATLKCNSNQKGNQPSTILGNNNGMVDINSETDADHAQTTKQINQHLQLQQSVPAQPENGRINYSNKAPPNHGTRHVVNMLGMFNYYTIQYHFNISLEFLGECYPPPYSSIYNSIKFCMHELSIVK